VLARIPLAEAAILYWLLFLSALGGSLSGNLGGPAFAPGPALTRTFMYTLPALLLVLLCLAKDGLWQGAGIVAVRGASDLVLGILLLAILMTISFMVSALFAAGRGELDSFIDKLSMVTPPPGDAPQASPPVMTIFAALMVATATGYFEELFFRSYLLRRLIDAGSPGLLSAVMSSILFAICHAYLGAQGIANAALAGLVLSAFRLRGRSIHPLAWAHGAYNAFALLGALPR